MISNEEAARIIPEHGFVRIFYEYVCAANDVPHVYIPFVALAGLAACTPGYVMTPEHEGKVKANMFLLLTGPTGGRKTTTMDYMTSLIEEVDEELLQTKIGSIQYLEQHMAKAIDNRVMLAFSEFGTFLRTADQQAGKVGHKEALTGLYDGTVERGGTISRGKEAIKRPRLTVMAACNQSYLYAFTTTADWGGGFLGRFVIAAARYEHRPFRRQEVDPTFRTDLKAMLSLIHRSKGKFSCSGATPGARDLYEDFAKEIYATAGFSAQDSFLAAKARLGGTVRKLAMLYAIDRMATDAYFNKVPLFGEPWYLTEYDMWYAVNACNLHWIEAQKLAAEAPPTREAAEKWRVLASLEKYAEHYAKEADTDPWHINIPRSYLMADRSGIGLPSRKMDDYLMWLEEAGQLIHDKGLCGGRDQLYYRLLPQVEEVRVQGPADALMAAAADAVPTR